jgi:hypothetical protein
MDAKPGLKPFYDLYAIHQGEPKFWSDALEKTKDFVEKVLQEGSDPACANGVTLLSLDLSYLSAFLRNQSRLEDFLETEYFIKEKHTPLLINLLRLGYKTTAGFDAGIMESDGYIYLFSGDCIDILKLCRMGSNKKAGDIILENKILLYDKEEY